MKKFFKRIYMGIFLSFMTLFLFICTYMSIFYTCKLTHEGAAMFFDDSLTENIFMMMVLFVCGFVIYKFAKPQGLICKICEKKEIPKIFFILSFILSIGFVIATQFNPSADPASVCWIAENIMKNDYRELFYDTMSGYMARYSQQRGIVLWIYAIWQVFGIQNYLILQIINVVAIYVGYIYVLKILTFIWGDFASTKLAWVAMIFFAPFNMVATYIYGTFIGWMFMLISIWHALKFYKMNKWTDALLCGASIGLSVQFRKNFFIGLIAIVILGFVIGVAEKKKEMLKLYISILIGVIFSSIMVNLFYNKISKLQPGDSMPAVAWIAMGIDGENIYGPGTYNCYNDNVYDKNNGDAHATRIEAKNHIKERVDYFIKNPGYTLDFFKKKTMISWGEPTFATFSLLQDMPAEKQVIRNYISSTYINGTKPNKIITKVLNLFQSFVYIGCLCYLATNYKKMKINETIFMLIFCGGFVFHTFWETTGRYTLPYFILLIPFAVKGWIQFCCNIYKKLDNALIMNINGKQNL